MVAARLRECGAVSRTSAADIKKREATGVHFQAIRNISAMEAVAVVFCGGMTAIAQDVQSPFGPYGLNMSGFFDVRAEQLREADNIFSLGLFELDLEASFNEHFGGSMAMVFEDGAAEIGVGLIDLHFFREEEAASSARGRIFQDPGYHIQIGRFDVPFGIDYQFYATPDRIAVSAPLYIDFMLDGGWTDTGLRAYKSFQTMNAGAFLVNGFNTGYAAGGRFGIMPFRNPYNAHALHDVPLFEIGVSGAWDADRESRHENTLRGVDSDLHIGAVHLIAEYVSREDVAAHITAVSWYAQTEYRLERGEMTVYSRYEEYRPDTTVSGTLSRVAVGVNRSLFQMAMLKGEYQTHLQEITGIATSDDMAVMQLVITF